jgi:hypothetical protein
LRESTSADGSQEGARCCVAPQDEAGGGLRCSYRLLSSSAGTHTSCRFIKRDVLMGFACGVERSCGLQRFNVALLSSTHNKVGVAKAGIKRANTLIQR